MFVGGSINNVGGNADDRVGGHMHLHTEMPGIPFFAAGHFRIALPAVVLRRARRFDEARVNDSPFMTSLTEALTKRARFSARRTSAAHVKREVHDRGGIDS